MGYLRVSEKGEAYLREYQRRPIGPLLVYPGAQARVRLNERCRSAWKNGEPHDPNHHGVLVTIGGYIPPTLIVDDPCFGPEATHGYMCWPTEAGVPIMACRPDELEIIDLGPD
jgi:hypothetical protein